MRGKEFRYNVFILRIWQQLTVTNKISGDKAEALQNDR